ncbi:MAG TPA: hypothetical protein VK116_12560, partial [Planctomycetota bacterium]|nr:hypothetical protein [Planctomycetota bacterium]
MPLTFLSRAPLASLLAFVLLISSSLPLISQDARSDANPNPEAAESGETGEGAAPAQNDGKSSAESTEPTALVRFTQAIDDKAGVIVGWMSKVLFFDPVAAFAREPADERGPLGARKRAMLALISELGLSPRDIAALELADYQASEKLLRRERLDPPIADPVKLGDAVTRPLNAWIAVRGSEPGALFVEIDEGSVGTEPISPETVREAVALAARDRAITALAVELRFQPREIAGLELSDYDATRDEMLLREAILDGPQAGPVKLTEAVTKPLDAWVVLRGSDPGPLFVTVEDSALGNAPIAPAAVRELVATQPPGVKLVVLWLIFGAVFFTLMTRFVNIWGFRHAIDLVRGKYSRPGDGAQGEV